MATACCALSRRMMRKVVGRGRGLSGSAIADGITEKHSDNYMHGYANAVVNQHAMRTADVFAAHVLEKIKPGMKILDVGCGPGSISRGLAERVPGGELVAMDVSNEVLERARGNLLNDPVKDVKVTVKQGSVYDLPFEDDTFDVVYANQVLQHLKQPVAALVEMRRVSKNIVTVRDADYETMVAHPDSEWLQRWRELYRKVGARNQVTPDAGRYLKAWLLQAGFGGEDIEYGATAMVMDTPDKVKNWGESWAIRSTQTRLAEQFLEFGYASKEDLEKIAKAWRKWCDELDKGPTFYYMDGHAIAYKRFN